MAEVVIMGGFTESKRLLEPVAEEAVKQNFGHDANVLTLRAAMRMDGEHLRSLMANKSVITHSAALLAVPDAKQRVSDSELPEDITIVAGPEPRSLGQLVGSAARKTRRHFLGERSDRQAHRRVIAGNTAELIAHPYANLSLVPDISPFSTLRRLNSRQIAAARYLVNCAMRYDEFYAYSRPWGWESNVWIPGLAQNNQNGIEIVDVIGNHDELLVDPGWVLEDVQKAQFAQAYGGASSR